MFSDHNKDISLKLILNMGGYDNEVVMNWAVKIDYEKFVW